MFPEIRFRVEVVEECRSSQEILLLKRGEPGFHGSAVLAKEQTAGFGRRGRAWSSGKGNFALSLGMEIQNPACLPLLPFITGIALYRATSKLLPTGADLRLKWPNDLYLNGKKLSGLISQVRQYAEGAEVVVGIGMNLAHAPASMSGEAIAISALAHAPDPEIFACAFLHKLEAALVDARDFDWVRREWERDARLKQDPLYVVGEEQSVSPLALLPSGELLVRNHDGSERALSSEDVSLRFQPTANLAPSP